MCFADFFDAYARHFPGTLAFDFLRYAIGAGGVFALVNVLLARRLARRRIRAEAPPAGQIRREILSSLRTVLVFALIGTTIGAGVEAGAIPVYFDIAERGWLWLALSTILLIVLHDAWFYWTHRLLHAPRLFRAMHRLHHRSRLPTPFAAYAFDLGEAFVNGIYLPLALLIVPAHPVAILVFVWHMMIRNAVGHCGFELFPAGPDGRPRFGWLTTVTHHDMHHERGDGHYGLYFTWWDRWMGTERHDYLARFAKAAGPLAPDAARA